MLYQLYYSSNAKDYNGLIQYGCGFHKYVIIYLDKLRYMYKSPYYVLQLAACLYGRPVLFASNAVYEY